MLYFEVIALYFIIILPIIISAILFTVSLVCFIKAKEHPELRARRKTLLIVSTVLLGIVIIAYVGIAVLLSFAIRNM